MKVTLKFFQKIIGCIRMAIAVLAALILSVTAGCATVDSTKSDSPVESYKMICDGNHYYG